uniref:Col_cuticle_N domain-containing protein n=1 Tax=Heterorhabditis bacteriophora TaxID=37862 RepID=A0A1I7XT83_HETBA
MLEIKPLNISMPTEVQIHFHIIHASINQNEQTMTLHGHLYMFAKVEMYPTFSIKVGCNLDYSAFPYDVNTCALSIFATQRMSEVQLKVYYGMPPTLSLGWGDQADKRVISDFEIINVTNSLSYYKHGNTTDLEPITANEMAISWAYHFTVFFSSHYLNFNSRFILGQFFTPQSHFVVSAIFNILPFFLPSLTYAIYSFVSNVVLQAVFLQELINKLPLVANTVPKSVSFYSITMLLNVTSLALHLVFHYLTDRHDPPPKLILSLLSLLKFTPFTPKNSTEQDNNNVGATLLVSLFAAASIYGQVNSICPDSQAEMVTQECLMGPTGPPGLDGSPGKPGEKGDDAEKPLGRQGPRGPPGEQGPEGLDGSPGRDAYPGQAGPIGEPGVPGYQGAAGPDGEEGPRGPSGGLGQDAEYCKCPDREGGSNAAMNANSSTTYRRKAKHRKH